MRMRAKFTALFLGNCYVFIVLFLFIFFLSIHTYPNSIRCNIVHIHTYHMFLRLRFPLEKLEIFNEKNITYFILLSHK